MSNRNIYAARKPLVEQEEDGFLPDAPPPDAALPARFWRIVAYVIFALLGILLAGALSLRWLTRPPERRAPVAAPSAAVAPPSVLLGVDGVERISRLTLEQVVRWMIVLPAPATAPPEGAPTAPVTVDRVQQAAVLLVRARNARRAEEPAAALAALNEAVRLLPQLVGAEAERFALALELKDWTAAEAALTPYLADAAAAPDWARHNLGVLRAFSGRMEDARAAWTELLTGNEALPATHFNLGLLALAQRDLPAAIRHFQRHVQLQPQDPTARLLLAAALRAGLQWEAVIQALDAPLPEETLPSETRLFRLAEACTQTKRFSDALRYFRNGLDRAGRAEALQWLSLPTLQPLRNHPGFAQLSFGG